MEFCYGVQAGYSIIQLPIHFIPPLSIFVIKFASSVVKIWHRSSVYSILRTETPFAIIHAPRTTVKWSSEQSFSLMTTIIVAVSIRPCEQWPFFVKKKASSTRVRSLSFERRALNHKSSKLVAGRDVKCRSHLCVTLERQVFRHGLRWICYAWTSFSDRCHGLSVGLPLSSNFSWDLRHTFWLVTPVSLLSFLDWRGMNFGAKVWNRFLSCANI